MVKLADTLDYSPLNWAVTKADIASYKEYSKRTNSHNLKWGTTEYGMAMLGALLTFGFLYAIIDSIVNRGINVGVVGVVLMFGAGGWILYKTIAGRTKMLAKLYKFSLQNRLTLHTEVENPNLQGVIFSEGHSRTVSEALTVRDGTEIGNYQYVTGSGKNRTTHEWAYVRVPLVRNLPNMVLDSKKNNLFGKVSNLPVGLGGNVMLELEGDFNKHFTLYVPQGYERDALYVFTPDVMAALVDSGAGYDMETIDNNLMMYRQTRFLLDSEIELRGILGIIESVAGELRDQTENYADERANSQTQNVIAVQGSRLKNRAGAFSIFVAGVIGIVILFQLIQLISAIFE